MKFPEMDKLLLIPILLICGWIKVVAKILAVALFVICAMCTGRR